MSPGSLAPPATPLATWAARNSSKSRWPASVLAPVAVARFVDWGQGRLPAEWTMTRDRLLALVSLFAGLWLAHPAGAQECVKGRCLTVNVPAARRAQLREVATQLAASGVP